MDIKKEILLRIYLTFFVIFLLAVAVVFQAFHIQTWEGERWTAIADSLTIKEREVPADRGNIFSTDGRLLASSLPYFDIRMDVLTPAIDDNRFYQKVDSLALKMSQLFDERDKYYYKNKMIQARKTGNRYLLIKRNVSYHDLQKVKSWPLFREGRYKGGLIVIHKNRRVKPFGLLANRTIGYFRNTEGAASVGLEASFDDYLSGVNGKQLMQKVSGGNWVPLNTENEVEPENGSDITTTIDLNMQDVLENSLYNTLVKHDADHGCAVLMEVETGKIKAIANLGRTAKGQYWEDYNYAIGEAREPGSTFKLPTIMALLEDGMISLQDSVDIERGKTTYHGEQMNDSEPHDHGKVSVQYAFEVSSNVGISKLADHHYSDRPDLFIEQLKQFRLDKKVGIEIAGEADPLIRTPEDEEWSQLSVPWMSVGYEVMISPLQTLTFYNAVANNGKMMSPYLVDHISSYGRKRRTFEPIVLDPSIASQPTIEKAQHLLEGVVERGTAQRVRTEYFKIAGKTGTAQIARGSSGYSKVYQASFVGYFPAENPKYSCIVVVNAPSKGVYYGGSVAGPVFKEVAEKVYALSLEKQENLSKGKRENWLDAPTYSPKGFQEDFRAVYQDIDVPYRAVNEEVWVDASVQNDTVTFASEPVKQGVVPDVRGMGLRDALYLLENRGLEVNMQGTGKVVWQSVKPGTPIVSGGHSSITIKMN